MFVSNGAYVFGIWMIPGRSPFLRAKTHAHNSPYVKWGGLGTSGRRPRWKEKANINVSVAARFRRTEWKLSVKGN